uniref:Uncharacterized protein n=1 Tax=Globodera pallida TaxID=36090 RepID=A0A183CND4_GLOPA
MLSMLINDQVNLHIIPLNREMPMPRDQYRPTTAAQKVYSMAKKTSIDTVCHFDQKENNRCVLNYFQIFNDKKEMLQESLRRWLFGYTYEELSDKENFFLIAILNNLIDESINAFISFVARTNSVA